ncbi:MAG: tRNA (5-methylaminomethyl-2-thiouridylate)-methyltransferase [Gammaproteobacteria bacterium]|nr:tRNA (5-methylaminomethyl-2-thiouridylate)-methyltransferase [Gammaproteobacteria bacterium]
MGADAGTPRSLSTSCLSRHSHVPVQRKAVALISGGLDSMLAAKVMLEQGIHVEGINFYTGFCVEGHTHAIRNHEHAKPKRNNALWTAEQLGIKLHIIEVIEEYKDVVINPKHGYGANLNPCLDCKGFMVRKAREWMEKNGFDFIITGEVLGQRPMSQRRDTLPVVARESGAFDRLLRPLCAKLLPETLPEREGWVDRNKLLDFNGRSRKPQMALAAQYGIKEYAQPAGGCCFLTNEQYSHKLADLWTTRGSKQYEFDDIMLLKVGRHLRPRPNFKLIVGRDEGENNFLHGYRKRFTHLYATSHQGPLVLIDGNANDEDIELAARLTARFGKGREAEAVTLTVTDTAGNSRELKIAPLPANDIPPEWYL